MCLAQNPELKVVQKGLHVETSDRGSCSAALPFDNTGKVWSMMCFVDPLRKLTLSRQVRLITESPLVSPGRLGSGLRVTQVDLGRRLRNKQAICKVKGRKAGIVCFPVFFAGQRLEDRGPR